MREGGSLAPLYGAAFVLAVDSAGAGHLFPALEEATRPPPGGASWFLSIYMLGALLGAPLLARVASRHGRTKVLAIAIGAFSVASFVVGLSSSYPLTLTARFLQGLAGSPIMPLGAAHLSASAAPGTKGKGLGIHSLSYSGGFLAGMAFVSLFLLVSFRLAYFFTGAIAAVVAILVARLPSTNATSNLDAPHVLHVKGPPATASIVGWFVALALLSLAVNRTRLPGAPPHLAEIVAAVAIGFFLWSDRRAAAPLLPRSLLRSRPGIASVALALAAGLGQASVVLLPTCGIVQLGVSAAASGPLLVPIIVGGLGANLLVSARLDRWGPRVFLGAGIAAIVAGDVVIALFGTSLVPFEIGALFLGSGVSAMSSGALRYLATLHGPADDADANQAAVSLLTNVGLLVGGALWGAIVPSAVGIAATTIRAGLFVLAATLLPLAFGVAIVPPKGAKG